jgi:hypothetical protein
MYDHVASSPLKAAVTGDVYKGQRPLGSEVEDVTINCLPITGDQLQRCVVNVNVFVPDLTISNEAGEESVADFARLAELEPIALQAVKEYQSLTHSFYVQQATLFKDNESKSHYLNIRVEFYAANLNLN